jgi:hypothetical protein
VVVAVQPGFSHGCRFSSGCSTEPNRIVAGIDGDSSGASLTGTNRLADADRFAGAGIARGAGTLAGIKDPSAATPGDSAAARSDSRRYQTATARSARPKPGFR